MRHILILATLFVFASCSLITKQTYVYTGEVTYYMPNGETESYNAAYTEYFFNGLKESGNLSVDVGVGNIFIFNGIPYTFKGHLEQIKTSDSNDESIKKVTDRAYVYTYNAKDYLIPADVYNSLKYKSNGNKDKLTNSIIDYIKSNPQTYDSKEQEIESERQN